MLSGDDEQSDFFHEIGPACGIPGIIPWWEANQGLSDTRADLQLGVPPVRDPNFDRILNGSFEYMSESSKRSFKARLKMLGKVSLNLYIAPSNSACFVW